MNGRPHFYGPIKLPSDIVYYARPSSFWLMQTQGSPHRDSTTQSLFIVVVVDHCWQQPCARRSTFTFTGRAACLPCHLQPARLVWEIDGGGPQQRTRAPACRYSFVEEGTQHSFVTGREFMPMEWQNRTMRASSARAYFLWPFTIARGNFAPHLPCARCMSSLVRCTIVRLDLGPSTRFWRRGRAIGIVRLHPFFD